MLTKSNSLQYEQFKYILEDLENNTRLIGEGAESKVYRTDLLSTSYAIKVAKEGILNSRNKIKDRGLMTKSKITSGTKAQGINGLEQFVTGSTEDYVAIYELVDGIKLSNISDKYIDSVTDEQKANLNRTILEATNAGLMFDSLNPSGANAFYSPSDGFTLIDYSEAYTRLTYRENWSAAMRSLGPIALRAFAT